VSGDAVTAVSASGLKSLAGAGLFVAAFAATICLIVPNVGTLPQTAIGASSAGSSLSAPSVNMPHRSGVLGMDPVGTSQVALRMTPFTSVETALRLGDSYGMQLVGSYPAFGRYLFDLPEIRVDPTSSPDTAIVYFAPRSSPAEISTYLSANELRVLRWYRSRDVVGEEAERSSLVSQPRIQPVLVDRALGIRKATIPANLDQASLAACAASGGMTAMPTTEMG
jgi:hypothetical protein